MTATLPARLTDLAGNINAEHQACFGAANKALDHALRCGELLIEAKEECGHGQWTKWLADNFSGSETSARAYMRLACRRDEIESKRQSSADLTIENALHYIARRENGDGKPTGETFADRAKRLTNVAISKIRAVKEFDDIVADADASGEPHEFAYQEFHRSDIEPGEDLMSFADRKKEIDEWRSEPWFADAEKNLEEYEEWRRTTGAVLATIDEADKIRKNINRQFSEWSRETKGFLDSSPGWPEDRIEQTRAQAEWWERVLGAIYGTWGCQVKHGLGKAFATEGAA